MIVLFVNAHRNNEEGKLRFESYYQSIRRLLKQTIYYGNEINEIVRNKDDLKDFIYDEITFRCEEKAKQRFQSIEYVFIDGSPSTAPWSPAMSQVLLLIRSSLKAGKKIHCNGFGHLAAYFYISTQFQKAYAIASSKKKDSPSKEAQSDYQYDEINGDLLFKSKKVCNSGIMIFGPSNRQFSEKSSAALGKGIILPTKFHFVAFDSKNGHKTLKNINFPFTFYWRGKVFCTPKAVSKAKAQILVQTENGNPLAFIYKNNLSTQGLCPQFLRVIQNWLLLHSSGNTKKPIQIEIQSNKDIAFDNKISLQKYLNSYSNTVYTMLKKARPQSSKFSTVSFEKPSLRCSGSYKTQDERYLQQNLEKKIGMLGKSRMNFHGHLDELQIDNYVQRTPSRPASSHKFRQVEKNKWIAKDNFYNY